MKQSLIITAFGAISFFGSWSFGQRPTAPQLFSGKAVAYARVNDTRELKDKLAETATGKLANDKDLKPILNSFYSSFSQLVQGMQNEIGLNLDELLSIPNGELAVAVVPTKTQPVFCFLLEAGSEMPAVEILLKRIEARGLERGNRERTTKEVGRLEVVQYKTPNPTRQFGYFIDSGVLVGCASAEYAETLAQIWQGSGVDHTPLAENRNFTDILSRCVGTEGERPQISFYVDPVGIARETLKQSSSASTFVALTAMKSLGLEGFKAMGGSVIMATNEFDSILHLHMLMETNRQGVLRALRPKSGSTEPEAWVDDSVVSYSTINWDIPRTMTAVQEIVDTFGGENAFEDNFVKNASRAMGVDFRKDIIENLADRITLTQMILPEKKINSQSNVIAIHIKDESKFKNDVLPKLYEKAKGSDSRWTTRQVGDIDIHYLEIRSNSAAVRAPQPSFALIGKTLLVSDASESIERAIGVYNSGENLLSDAIEFKLIRDKIKAQLKGQDFSIMSYQRPDEQLKLFYDLANDPKNIDRLEEMSENNPVFQSLVTALRSRQLPPFEQISKYIVPTGAFMTEEESGLHYTAFSLKRE